MVRLSGFRFFIKLVVVFLCAVTGAISVFQGCVTFPGGFTGHFDYDGFAERQREDPVSNASIFINSIWEIDQFHPVTGERIFSVRFYKNGVLQNLHPNDNTPSDDRWDSDDIGLNMYFNDSYAVYSGVIENHNEVKGTAGNRNGDVWNWRAKRLLNE